MLLGLLGAGQLVVSSAIAGDEWSLPKPDFYFSTGTLGAGVVADWRLDLNWGIRGDLHAGRFSFINKNFNADLDNDISLLSGGLTADYYLGESGVRLSAGARLSANKVTGDVRNLRHNVTIFGRDVVFTIPDPLTRYTVTQNMIQPYAGAGLVHRFSDNINVSLDFGALYTGTPKVDVTSHAGRLGFTAHQIQEQIDRAQRRANAYQVFPVVQLGIQIKF